MSAVAEARRQRLAAAMGEEGLDLLVVYGNAWQNDYLRYPPDFGIPQVEAFLRARGVDDNFMIIGVGGKEVRGMAPPMGKKLKRSDLVTTELTPCIDGYYLQICRTLVVGEPTSNQHAAFNVYREALVA